MAEYLARNGNPDARAADDRAFQLANPADAAWLTQRRAALNP